MKQYLTVAAILLAMTATGCGDLSTGRSPALVVISSLTAGEEESSFLNSDVITMVQQDDPTSCTILNDPAGVSMTLVLRDPGLGTTPAVPTAINQVTFTSYRVVYRRTDGRNVEGVDVPYAFSSGVTFTVPASGSVTVGFNLVRQTAKLEAPLLALRNRLVLISTIAEVTFFGRDLAGHDVIATGTIGITFGDFGASCS